jgi:hypothetical protein
MFSGKICPWKHTLEGQLSSTSLLILNAMNHLYHFGFFPPTRGIAKSNAIFTKFLFLWFAYYCDGNAL